MTLGFGPLRSTIVTVSGSGFRGTVCSPSTNNTLFMVRRDRDLRACAPWSRQQEGEDGGDCGTSGNLAIHERSLWPVDPQIFLQAIPFQTAVPRAK
jgi:hypothetical protein